MNAPQDRRRFRRHPGSRKRPSRHGSVDPSARQTALSERTAPVSPQSFNVVPVSARQYAFVVLNEARRTGQFVDDILERQPGVEDLSTADRRFLTELINGVTRRSRTLDAILSHYVTRPAEKVEPALRTLLQLGAYQLVLMTGVSSHAAVNETVLLAGWLEEPRWKGFLNGVLRAISREVTDEFVDEPARNCVPVVTRAGIDETSTVEAVRLRRMDRDVLPDPKIFTPWLATAFGLPSWLLYRWNHRFSDSELHDIAKWFEQRAPITLRVNPLKGTRDELLAMLNDAEDGPSTDEPRFVSGSRPESIQGSGSVRVTTLPGFEDGRFTVQDEAAMSAAELLAPQPGQSVLDLCAAPGTKTTHIAELMQNTGNVLAADSDAERLRRVYENASRLGLDIIEPLHVADDSRDLPITLFDAVLVDVPCSNTGVIGKRPEVRTRLQERDIEDLAQIQLALLRSAASRVKPGGRLVYSTCSIEPQENTGVINALLSPTSDFTLEEVRELIPGRPSDGGFQALLVRSS